MKKVYLDNAATTQILPEVVQEMVKVMNDDFGNASSTHAFGRHAKGLLEISRKSIAKELHATAQEIIFTSGGTEGNNWILRNAVKEMKVARIITSRIEHHAVLHAIDALRHEFAIAVDYVKVLHDGNVDVTHLVELLSDNKPTLVSLMHVNNETGNLLDLERIGKICRQHQAYFHSDTIQSVGKTAIDLNSIPIDFIVASAHKFHGPKGVGFVFARKGLAFKNILFGGEQEKGLRPGTESTHNIVGMAKALELSHANLEKHTAYIIALKKYLLDKFHKHFPGFKINGDSSGFYNIVNVMLPLPDEKTALILFHLDMKGIAISRGSACQSGSTKPSHVLAEILPDEDLKKPSLRISLSHFNTAADIDYLIEVLETI
jgi:cysteine desulfurase